MTRTTDLSPEALPTAPGRPVALVAGLLTVLLAVVTVWTVPRPTGDLYVALAAGRDILDGKLNKLDDWSFTTVQRVEYPDGTTRSRGRIWVNQNWGTHLLYYFSHRIGLWFTPEKTPDPPSSKVGEVGLLALKLLLLLTGAAFLTLACRLRGADWGVALIVSGGVLAAGRSFIDLRPNLTTLMFVPVMLYLLYRTIDRSHRMWVVMVVFGLLWANLHGGFYFGLLVMGFWSLCVIVPQLIASVWRKEGPPRPAGRHRRPRDRKRKEAHRDSRQAHADLGEEERTLTSFAAVLRRYWPLLAATAGAILLAGVLTPFGIHNLWRTDTTHSFTWMWNLTHPLVVLVSPDSEAWQSVIEWHSIFTASTRTFGTSWEFFAIVGLFCLMVPIRVLVKLVRREALTLEEMVLLAGILVVVGAILAQAWPVWDKFASLPALRRAPDAVEPRAGWLAAIIAYVMIGLFALTVALSALFGVGGPKRRLARVSAGQVGMLVFDVFMAGLGIKMAFGARRFIPLALLLLAPMVALQLQWLLRALGRVWPRVWTWVVAALLTGAGVGWLTYVAISIGAYRLLWWVVLAPVAAVAVHLLLRSIERLWAAIGRGLIVPSVLIALVVLYTVSIQTRSNALAYWPNSPLVRDQSMLKCMIVYRMFPPGPRDFINDNDITGRVFNEWRWEGYLRWHCLDKAGRPRLKLFLGGRAQQVYDVETYKLQQRILRGVVEPGVLRSRELAVEWIVVPLNASYTRLLQNAVYSATALWVPIFCDGENVVLAHSRLPRGQKMIQRCLGGDLKYRNAETAALSRALCLSSRVVGKTAAAIAAMKESHKYRPIYMAYNALDDLYKATRINVQKEIDYMEAENRRLAAMDYNRYRGAEILQCRQAVLRLLKILYTASIRDYEARGRPHAAAAQKKHLARVWREAQEIKFQIDGVIAEWR